MKIVEYNNKYAAQVADMWNKSGSNWGNDSSVRTAEDIILRESKSGNLKLYLAMDNDEVVGYCSFSEYEHDEGASYLPLLNVRPDYHGKKVGKALILKVIEDAVKAPWPRFDLFTWSGNIKAMPLYKKCGFFWEKNNESVHLMNFIPYLYQTEVLQEELQKIDWYKDSKRVIDMNQDGVMENGFDIFSYHFQNEATDLRFEFEKSGRGLRLIETPDYQVQMSVEKHELVFNQTYNVTFKMINKTKKELTIKLEGINNKNIETTFNELYNVKDELIVSLPFTVNKTSKKQDKFKTYPVVETNVYINGLKSTFKLGIDPKSPLFLETHITEYNHVKNLNYKGYLDLENNLDISSTFLITLPNNHIDVLDKLEVTLQPKEKRSLTFNYKVKEFGFINDVANVSYNNDKITCDVKSIIKGHKEIFHGETDKNVYLIDGNYMISYDKEHNRFSYQRGFTSNRPNTAFMAPQIGLPYNLEFSNINAVFTYPTENILQAELVSKAFEDVSVIVSMESNRGILNTQFTLVNKGSKKELALSIPVWKNFNDTIVPYDGKLLRTNTKEGGGVSSLDSNLIDEKWFFDNKDKAGFTWDKKEELKTSGWRMASSKEDIILDTDEIYTSGVFTLSYVHPDLKSFRRFAGEFTKKEDSRFLEITQNNGNPFTKNDVTISLTNKRKKEMEGTISSNDATVELSKTLQVEPGLNTIKLDTKDTITDFTRLSYKISGEITKKEIDDSLVVSNGVLTFKASNNYFDGVYSLTFNNHEWLDSNYPEPKERSWWGTFTGGINTRYEGLQDHVTLKEPRTAEFVDLVDNFGNKWEGIKTTVSFQKEEDVKGLLHENFYLTLPGVPVMYNFTKVTNNMGKLMNDTWYTRFNTLQLDDSNTNATFEFGDTTYKCGNVGVSKEIHKLVQFSSTREYKLSIYNKENFYEMDTQKDYTICFSDKKHVIADNSSKIHCGDFLVFTKEELKKDFLIDLENIKFEV